MPRLPQNVHLVTTWRSPDNAIRKITPQDRSKVWRLPRRKSIATATQNDFRHVTNTSECHEVPRLPRKTKQRDVRNLQKWPLLQNLP